MFKQIFWPVLAPAFLYQVGSGALSPVIVLAALSLGASHAGAGAIVTVGGIAAILASVPAGHIIQRLGDRASMLLATVIVTILTVVMVVMLSTHPTFGAWVFGAAVVLVIATEVVWSLARQALVAETVPPHQVGMAMTSLGGTARAGQLVGPALGALLLVWFPLESVFILHIVAALAATALIWGTKLRNPTPTGSIERTKHNGPLEVRWTAVLLAGFSIITLSMARRGMTVIIPLWGSYLHLTASAISLLVALGTAIELVLMVPGGILKDRMGRTSVLATCLILLGAGFVIMPLSASVGMLIAGLVVASVGNGLGAGINMTIGADLSPSVGRAKFLGYWSSMVQTGTFAGPGLITLVIGIASLPAAIVAIGVAPLIGAAWLLAFQNVIALPSKKRLDAARAKEEAARSETVADEAATPPLT